jgi:hypothetical protein
MSLSVNRIPLRRDTHQSEMEANMDPSVLSFAELVLTKLSTALIFATMLGAPDASLVQGLRFISVICLLISSWHFGFHGTPTLRAFRSVVGPRGPPPGPDGLIMLHLLGLPADALLRDRRRPLLLIGSAVPWAGGST